MKLQIPFKLLGVLLIIPFFALAHPLGVMAKITKEKNIKKTFNVSANHTLKVINSYGNLDVVTWNENRIDFDIIIKVTGGNSDKVQDRLNEITVDFESSGDMISAITRFGGKKNSWWNWGGSKKLKVEVNYRIKMPITNNVNFSNDYGTINLGKIEGTTKISCDYGKITTQELMGSSNAISFDYSDNCYFEYIKNGEITADYSGFTVANAKNIQLTADYTKSVFENVENVEYTCDYGSLKIDNINNLEGNGDYLTLRLGNVYKNVAIQADYGSIKIDRMASKARNININTEFTGITIGLDQGYAFNFDIDLDYASLNYPDSFNFTVKEKDLTEKKYKGFNNTQNSGNLVKINSEYGSVTFKTN
jgi:hypothetical protein